MNEPEVRTEVRKLIENVLMAYSRDQITFGEAVTALLKLLSR